MKATIVTTTINVPYFLEDYAKNADQFGHNVDFIVVGDRKTPSPETAKFCNTIPNCEFLHVLGQETYLERFPELEKHLPYNSPERRNVGMLKAYEQGADIIITLDDDNYITSHDVIRSHGIVGKYAYLPIIGSSTGWFNVCSMLQERDNVEFHHRGYPPAQRWLKGFETMQHASKRVVVNAGLWVDNPDVDAITRLERELQVDGFKPGRPTTIGLAPGTWSPFNCQNTALHRDVIPAYFLSPFIGRHADIFASYVINRIAEHMNDAIAFGEPLARHDRSEHDLWKDLNLESDAMRVTDSFVAALRSIKLTGKSYHSCFGEITRGLWPWAVANYKELIVDGMARWHDIFEEVEV